MKVLFKKLPDKDCAIPVIFLDALSIILNLSFELEEATSLTAFSISDFTFAIEFWLFPPKVITLLIATLADTSFFFVFSSILSAKFWSVCLGDTWTVLPDESPDSFFNM